MKSRQFFHAVLTLVTWCAPAGADDWPQWRGPNRDGVWRETGVVDRFEGPELKIRWRASIAGGYSGPTVAEGRVLVSDRIAEPEEQERIHAFDATTGRRLWTHAYPCPYGKVSYKAGPRAAVVLDEGRAYALGSTGHFCCLDVATGKLLWEGDFGGQDAVRVPTWGVAAAPLVEKDLVIVQIGAVEGACLVALDKRTGQERWRALDDPPSYSAPIVIDQAGRRVVVCWTGTRVVGLDAATGKLYWAHEVGYARWVIGISSPVVDRDRLLITAADKGSLLLQLAADIPAVEKQLWWRQGPDSRPTDGLHCLISTPFLRGDYLYGVDTEGILRCLDAKTGDRAWENRTVTTEVRWGCAHLVQNGDRTWICNDRGELVIARLTPAGYEEISRAKLLKPTLLQLNRRDGVTWSHPAFAYRHVFARNDEELVCASLAAE